MFALLSGNEQQALIVQDVPARRLHSVFQWGVLGVKAPHPPTAALCVQISQSAQPELSEHPPTPAVCEKIGG